MEATPAGHSQDQDGGWDKLAWVADTKGLARAEVRGGMKWDGAETGGRSKKWGRGAVHSLYILPLLRLTSSEPQPWGRAPRGPLWKGWSSSAEGHSPSGAAGRARGLGATGHGSSEHGAGGQRLEICGRPWAAARWS